MLQQRFPENIKCNHEQPTTIIHRERLRAMRPLTNTEEPMTGLNFLRALLCMAVPDLVQHSYLLECRSVSQPLLGLLQPLALEPARLRRAAGPRVLARLGNVASLRHQLLQPRNRVAAIGFLRPKTMRLEDDLVVAREAPPRQRPQPLFAGFVEQRRSADEKPQLTGGRDLVDVLAAGA